MTEKLLSGYRVIEYTQSLGGAHCGRILSDLGAEVIKVEIPNDPDDQLRSQPPVVNAVSLAFANENSGKKSVLLDFRTEEGRAVMEKLLQTADAFLCTKRMQDMDLLGLGYKRVHALFPRLVYATLTCYGQSGPMSSRKGGDLVAQAFSGCMSATGYLNGRPLKIGYPIGESLGSLDLALGVIASLFKVMNGGTGQLVDVSICDAIIASMCTCMGHFLVNGLMPVLGLSLAGVNDDPQLEVPSARGIYPARDGWVCLSANHPHLAAKVFECIGKGDLLDDPMFKDEAEHSTLCRAINRHVNEWSRERDKMDVFLSICDAGAPAAPVLDYADLYRDETYAVERQMFISVEQPGYGSMPVTSLPIHMSDFPASPAGPMPAPGEHNRMLLAL